MVTKAFLHGFCKRASETYVAPAAPETGEHGRALLWNELGGADPRTPEDMDAAAAVGLLTLPKEETGASCSNCVHFRLLDPAMGAGFCTNPQVKQDVTVRMLCSVWENQGAHRPYDDVGAELPTGRPAGDVMEGDQSGLSDQIMGDLGGGADPAMEQGVEDTEAMPPAEPTPGEQEQAPQETGNPRGETTSPKPKTDKPAKADGHTINVNIGHNKKAFIQGFQKAAEEKAKPVSPYELYFFTASWAQPAKSYKKIFDQVASLYPEADVTTIDVEKERTHPLVTRLNIRSVPQVVVLRRGVAKPVEQFVGERTRDYTKNFFDSLFRGLKKEGANIHMILKRLGKFKRGTTVDAYLRRKR